ncbi:MAG: glycosyltransferase [Ignavibacteria bacterium]|nr:glycosyltransferase [Ignavibacteria bacterium]
MKFYFLNENRGFGAGCNYAAGKASGKYLLLVNPDIEFTNDAVSGLIRFMENDKTAGACSGLLLMKKINLLIISMISDYSWELKNAYGVGVEETISRLLSNPNVTGPKKILLSKLTGFWRLFFY